MSTRRRSWTWTLPLVLLAACSSQPAEQGAARTAATASPTSRALAGPASRPVAPIHALVQLTERPTAVAFRGRLVAAASTDASDATTQATQAAVQQLGFVQAEQAAFADRVAQARVPATNEVYRLQRIYNGIVYATDAAGLARLRALPGARAVHVLATQELQNAWGVPFVGAKALWSLGVPLHGENITVGVIDTGIDYTHANFGGPGTVAAYDANDKNLVEAGSFPTTKVVGGWDFAGADYNAASDATSFPVPDADPLDGNGHGSHVAGTVAGLGVTSAGLTYAGPYDVTLDPTGLRIGPGAAPAASLVALKVFGDGGGSTSLSALAVEWATDPNGDGDFSDHLDVINLSLGSSHGSPNDAEAVFYTNAVNAGVVVVASAGNSSDIYFVTGSPGATPAVISVAASTVGYYPSAVRIDGPAAIAAMVPAGTAAFGTASTEKVSGEVVATVPTTACASASAGGVTNGAALVGKIALIARGTCSFALKAKAAADAGAIGVLITNNVAGDPIGMANTVPPTVVTVPAFSLTLVDGNAIRAQLAVPAVVTATLSTAFAVQDLARADTIASFSSRGPTRLGNQTMLKPDVSAPGFQVISTAVGSGSEAANFSGTSMASPLTAGVMALLKQSRPTWTPAELKALLMNTAGHDVFNLPTPPKAKVSPARVGAGRIDALAATGASVVAYDKAAPERVSLSFATLDVSTATTEPRVIAVKNKGTTDVTYDVTVAAAVAPPGVQVTSGSATVTVLAGATADLAVSLVADPAAMVRQRDATVSSGGATPFGTLARSWLPEASGYVVLTPQGTGNGPVLRVPYFAAPTPASAMAASAPLATTGAAGSSDLTLSGTGVDTRALAVSPQQGVVSLVTPFELGWASPRTPPLGAALPAGYPAAEADIANLRYVGVTSNYTDVGADVASAELYFAVNTWAPWGSPSDVEFDVYVRQAGAPDWEYVLFNLDASRINSTNYSDVHFVYLVNLATGSTSGQDYVNGVSQAQIAVPTFMSDTMVLPVFAGDLGLVAGSTAIEYQVVAFSNRFGLVDQSPVLQHDLAAPAFATTIDPLLTTLGPGFTPFRVDAPAATIPVAYDLDRAKATQVGGLLLVHHTNAAGLRGQVVPVSGLSCAVAADCAASPATPTCDAASGACVGCLVNGDCASGFCDAYGTRTCQSADCRNPAATACPAHYACSLDNGSCQPNQAMLATLVVPANTTCPAGGLQVSTGFDDNHNGALDSFEVVTTNYVCNGLSASITPEAAGANCANGGTKVQVGNGTPSYVCNGATGATGAAGESATVTPEPAGANCPNGGVKVQVGSGTPAYACTGATGLAGDSAAVTPEPAGAICTNGGVRVQVGDADPTYVCNGITGATGPTGPTGPVGPIGPKGSSGCSSVGGGSSALSLLGLGLLLWRRRRSVKPAAV